MADKSFNEPFFCETHKISLFQCPISQRHVKKKSNKIGPGGEQEYKVIGIEM